MKLRLIFLVFLLLLPSAGCGRQPAKYADAPVKNGRVVIPLAEVADGKAHFFSYGISGRRVNFFIRTDSKGTVSAHYDACYTCYRFKKGYRQEGTDLICNECGMKFGLTAEKWEEKDGCNPIFLKSVIENSNLVIQTSVIEKGAKLF